jgi:hypothetical protein
VVVKVYRLGNIWLPQVGFVGIDWHGISCCGFIAEVLLHRPPASTSAIDFIRAQQKKA